MKPPEATDDSRPVARERVGELLAEIEGGGSFASRRTADADDLHIAVRGIGTLRFPVSREQARDLVRIARPARYGQGEGTLLDPRVRDTWEVPKSRIRIDKRRWNRTLIPLLDDLRLDLGLPDRCRLKMDFHSMLVYGPGQFFLPHQDSEKNDDMVGTLVVTLPSRFTGGELEVEHAGRRVVYRASKRLLSFVAFYADCLHEARPVKEGYRVVLTYNLLVKGGGTVAEPPAQGPPRDSEVVGDLERAIRDHFETRLPPHSWDRKGGPRPPPSRLSYLLDHQYTERGLGWSRLKGKDAARVPLLAAAAERAGCEAVLALAEIHETWECWEDGWDDRRYGRRGRWRRYEEDDIADPEPGGYTLGELYDSVVTLDRWIGEDGKEVEPIHTHLDNEETCGSTPTSAFQPYESEYEGYMGNYGNTMDRWYRRAAVVLWPRERAFEVRSEASPSWALKEIQARIRAGAVEEAREMAAKLPSSWRSVDVDNGSGGFFARTLAVAEGLDEPELAASLLVPFSVENLIPAHAAAFAGLVESYGEDWVRSLIEGWSSAGRRGRRHVREEVRRVWLAQLPRLCRELRASGAPGIQAARPVLRDRWDRMKEAIEAALEIVSPSYREEALVEEVAGVLALLRGTVLAGAEDIRDEAVAFLCDPGSEDLLPCLLGLTRLGAGPEDGDAVEASLGLDAVRRRAVEILEAYLGEPPRDTADWSITLPEGCGCALCNELARFLSAADRRSFDWPLAKQKRRHVHERLNAHELPVRHETRREGRPYVLELTKTDELFEAEGARRSVWRSELDRLSGGPP